MLALNKNCKVCFLSCFEHTNGFIVSKHSFFPLCTNILATFALPSLREEVTENQVVDGFSRICGGLMGCKA